MTFNLAIKVTGEYGLNKIYAGRHWSKRNADKDFWGQFVKSELRRQKIKRKAFDKPVYIKFYFDSRLDIDNHGYIIKLVIDSLKGYLLVDDNRKYVRGYSAQFYDGKGILVEIKEAIA